MLKTHWKVFSYFERLVDNGILLLSFVLGYYLRDYIVSFVAFFKPGLESGTSLDSIESYFGVLLVAIPVFNIMLSFLGAYGSMRYSSWIRLFRQGVLTALVVFVACASLLFVLKLDLSRSFLGGFCFFLAVLFCTSRWFVLRLLRHYRKRGRNFRNVFILGDGEHADRILKEFNNKVEYGIRVVGFSSFKRFQENVSSFEKVLKEKAVDEVLFVGLKGNLEQIEVLVGLAIEEGVGVSLAADFFSLSILNSGMSYVGETPIIHYQTTSKKTVGLFFKRLIDIVVSFILLIIFSPVAIAAVIAIKFDSKGPVLFKQRRVGLNGRTFKMYKFRSMVIDAEDKMAELKAQNEMGGPVFKIKKDPRVTSVGRFIRRLSIDELPQLWNVLKGDMSLVGPRPPLPEEVSLYRRAQRRRLSMRPGITCIWQVSGRNNIPDFETWAKLDLEYIDNWSLAKDLKLLLKTVPAVISGSGAR